MTPIKAHVGSKKSSAKTKKNDLPIEAIFIQNTQRRIIEAYLPIIIMTRLKEASITSASDIIATVKNRYSIQISPGTVYPVLYKLEKSEYIARVPQRYKQIFILTSRGASIETLSDSFQ